LKNQAIKYSNTLFDVSKKYNQLKSITPQLESIKILYKSESSFRLLLESKQIKLDIKKQILASVLESYEDLVKEFIYILLDNKLTNQLVTIINRFFNLASKDLDNTKIEIIAAQNLTKELLESLEKKLNCEIQLTVNPNIIGGVQLRQGNKIFDNSIAYQLNQLKNTLYNL
jgi:F-type H+-transporting ATPase subunit delta